MATASSSALALAAWLRARDDDALAAVIRARPVRESSIRDVFDLAEALLDESSVQSAIEHLDRPTLAVLAAAGRLSAQSPATPGSVAALLAIPEPQVAEAAEALAGLALVDDADGRLAPWDTVTGTLAGWPQRGLPSIDELIDLSAPVALDPVGDEDRAIADRGAADRAFDVVTAIGELVTELEREPARMLQRGGTALPDWRRLLAATHSDDDALHVLLAIAQTAGLVESDASAWRATEAGFTWRDASRTERWTALASAWLAKIPEELRDQLRTRTHARWGEGLRVYLDWLFPAGGAWLAERVSATVRAAEALGIVGDGVPSTPGAALLAEGPEAAAAAVRELFPADVRQVYIQHDLSVIAPGPLASDIDLRLRQLADVEAVGVASTFRITAASVTRALTVGATIDELHDFLAGISLTGMPQPLEYLLSETAGRFGSLRVGALDPEPGSPDAVARAYVRGDDPALVRQLAIDQALQSLNLWRSGEHRVVTRFDAEMLYWALVDARYPVVFEDGSGTIQHVQRRAPRRVAPVTAPVDTAVELVARLREASAQQPVESGAAWNARQLELAIKNKLAVQVTVRMPDDTEVSYLLEPAGLAGGRLRARDRRADIERTLPLSHITEVSPA